MFEQIASAIETHPLPRNDVAIEYLSLRVITKQSHANASVYECKF